MPRWSDALKVSVPLVAAALLVPFAVAHIPVPAPASPYGVNAPKVASVFARSITAQGPVAAYASFKRQYGRANYDIQHDAAHLFGGTLYKTAGLSVVATCDAEMNYGCYHGFFTKAISAEGLEVIPKLDSACDEATSPSACRHGLGHGILDYFGPKNLLKALDACRLTTQPNPLAGCTSGLFMEYNVPIGADENGALALAARPLKDKTQPYDICPSLPLRYQSSCYHELPQWWKQVVGGEMTTLGQLCAGAPTAEFQHACIDGLAGLIPSSAGYKLEPAVRYCTEMPAAFRSECFVVASRSFRSNFDQIGDAQMMCTHADAVDQPGCTL